MFSFYFATRSILRVRVSNCSLVLWLHDMYDAYMCKLGGTEKPHGKAPVLIIQTLATFLKVPLEAHDANKKKTKEHKSDASKRRFFSCRLGVRNKVSLL